MRVPSAPELGHGGVRKSPDEQLRFVRPVRRTTLIALTAATAETIVVGILPPGPIGAIIKALGTMTRVEVHQGAFHLQGYLSLAEQRTLVERYRELGRQPAGLYTPSLRSGRKMRVQMLCLGRHWNAKTYRYEATRSDYDNLPVPELPRDFAQLAGRIAAEVSMRIEPDICLVNLYTEAATLGLHQDKDERSETIAAGIPVVSVSLGDTAEFLLGGTTRREPVMTILLESGDAFVLGGPSRLRFHGVSALVPGTAPKELDLAGRFNLTFRQY